jgi:hypothetical protein
MKSLKNNDGWFVSATQALLAGVQADMSAGNLQVDQR